MRKQIVIYSGNYKAIIDSSSEYKCCALLVYLHAYYTDTLPATPTEEWLAEISLPLDNYYGAIALLENLGIVKHTSDGQFLIRSAT